MPERIIHPTSIEFIPQMWFTDGVEHEPEQVGSAPLGDGSDATYLAFGGEARREGSTVLTSYNNTVIARVTFTGPGIEASGTPNYVTFRGRVDHTAGDLAAPITLLAEPYEGLGQFRWTPYFPTTTETQVSTDTIRDNALLWPDFGWEFMAGGTLTVDFRAMLEETTLPASFPHQAFTAYLHELALVFPYDDPTPTRVRLAHNRGMQRGSDGQGVTGGKRGLQRKSRQSSLRGGSFL